MSENLTVDKAEAKLKEWKAKLDYLKAKAEAVEVESKQKINDQVTRLEKKIQEADTQLSVLQKKGEGKYEIIKDDLGRLLSDIGDTVKEAVDRVKK